MPTGLQPNSYGLRWSIAMGRWTWFTRKKYRVFVVYDWNENVLGVFNNRNDALKLIPTTWEYEFRVLRGLTKSEVKKLIKQIKK